MRVQTLTLGVLLLFLVVCFSFLQFVVTPSMLREADEFDGHVLQQDRLRLENYLALEQDQLMRFNRDWAFWDESYAYVRGEFPGYVEGNLMDSTFFNNQVQVVVFVNDERRIVYSKGMDLEGNEIKLPPSFIANILRQSDEMTLGGTLFYEELNNELMMMSGSLVTTSDQGDPSGRMIVGRMIDASYVARLSEAMSLNLAILSPEREADILENDWKTETLVLTSSSGLFKQQLSVAEERFYYEEKKQNLLFVTVAAMIVITLFAVVLYGFFRYFILSPLSGLAGQVKGLHIREDGSFRLFQGKRKRNLEVKELEDEINLMLEKLEDSHGQVVKMAFFDQLTELANRFYLYQEFEPFLARNDRSKAVLFFDLDGFKAVNDRYGHEVGDLLLKETAIRLKTFLDDRDTIIARIGGDEFVAVVTYKDQAQLEQMAQDLIALLSKGYAIGSVRTNVSASVGVSMYPEDGTSLSVLLNCADAAMYEAKANGKNQVVFYRELKEGGRYDQLEQLKRDSFFAIERNELSLVFQPILSGKTGRVAGVEALLRWHHPDFGAVSPGDFIPIMEENDLINEVGRWVMRKSLQQLSIWHRTGYPDLGMAVNFSKVQLKEVGRYLTELDDALMEYGVRPDRFTVEITESEVSYFDRELMEFIQALKKRKVKVSLDDFGTGTSSLYSLRELPVNTVKIDRSFMESIPAEAFNTSLLTGIYRILSELGIDVVTEGVENAAQLDFILKQSDSNVQGFYFSKPIPPDEVTDLLMAEAFKLEVMRRV